jgi:predicted amidohydrolase YtcJ
MRNRQAVLGVLVAAMTVAAPSPTAVTQTPADLVIVNANVVTLDDTRPRAQALAARAGRIVAVGTDAEVRALTGPATEVIDAAGQLIIPGFIEGHGHFTGIGTLALSLNLMHARSWDEIVAMVAERVKTAKPGEWIIGRGWHQEKWRARPEPNVEGFPLHDALSRVSPDNPVHLTHASGHASFANARAMAVSGVTRDTADPPGGDILKDAAGNPTGLFRETASRLIRADATASLSAEEKRARARRILELATREVLSKGITSFQDAGSSFEDVELIKSLIDEGRIHNRLWVMIRPGATDPFSPAFATALARGRTIGYGDGFLTVRGIKLSIDGALGPRGAWLLEPYADQPGTTGHNTVPVETVRQTARLAMTHGYQLCVHAIGDRANRETLDLFEEAFKANPGKQDLRWRIEHAQHLNPADIPRFGQLGVIASMQGVHCTSDAPFVPARLGAKRSEEGAYVWQKLMQSGAVVSNGTDAPVEDVDPIASYYATVTRRLQDGSVFYPDQRMSRLEALRSYTVNAARAAFEEDVKGTITVGKYADVVVLTKDILAVPDEEIRDAGVAYTIVGGKVRHRR